jgi:methylmalonyl-CoA decarboxylase subunit alpha
MSTKEKLEQLKKKRAQALLGGGQDKIDKIHEKGKKTARERINALLDPGTFEEYDAFKLHRCYNFGMEKIKFLGDGIVTGYGKINGRGVYLYAQDFSVLAGSLSGTLAEKICKVMDLGMKNGLPVIGLNDSGGARIQEGIEALAGYTEIFTRNVLSSGVVPQISGVFGPCAGGAVYSPALTDFIIQVKVQSYMFLTGPKVVKTVCHEDVTTEQLGGAVMHTTKSGVTDYAAENEDDAIQYIRDLLSYLPQNNLENPPDAPCDDPITRKSALLNEIIPDNPNAAYDMKKVITETADNGIFLKSRKILLPISSLVLPDIMARVSVLSPTSHPSMQACLILTLPSKGLDSFVSVIVSIFRSSLLSMFPASCPAPIRNSAVLSAMAPKCSMPMLNRPCLK